MKRFIRILFTILLPALFIAYGSGKIFDFTFSDNAPLEANIKIVFFILGFLLTYGIIPVYKEVKVEQIKHLQTAIAALLPSLRYKVSNELENHLMPESLERGKERLMLSIRIFVPEKKNLKEIFTSTRRFRLIDQTGLSSYTVKDLSFMVSPPKNCQGLVGKCYESQTFEYSFNLTNQREESYRLDANQKSKTEYCKFVIATPLFKGTSNRVMAIVTFDSVVSVTPPSNDNWKEPIRSATQILHIINSSYK